MRIRLPSAAATPTQTPPYTVFPSFPDLICQWHPRGAPGMPSNAQGRLWNFPVEARRARISPRDRPGDPMGGSRHAWGPRGRPPGPHPARDHPGPCQRCKNISNKNVFLHIFQGTHTRNPGESHGRPGTSQEPPSGSIGGRQRSPGTSEIPQGRPTDPQGPPRDSYGVQKR